MDEKLFDGTQFDPQFLIALIALIQNYSSTTGYTGSATLAKLTPTGHTGSISFVNGLATSYSAPA